MNVCVGVAGTTHDDNAHVCSALFGMCSEYNTGCLTAIEVTAVDVLDKAMEHCRNCMVRSNTHDAHTFRS